LVNGLSILYVLYIVSQTAKVKKTLSMTEEILGLINDKEVGKKSKGTTIKNELFNNPDGADYQ